MPHPTIKLADMAHTVLAKLQTDLPALVTAEGLPAIALWTVAHPMLLLQHPTWSGKYLPTVGVDYNYPNGLWRRQHVSLSGDRMNYRVTAFVLTQLEPTEDVAAGIIGHPSMLRCAAYQRLILEALDAYHDDATVPFYKMFCDEGGVRHVVNSAGLPLATEGQVVLTAVSDVS